MKYIKEIVGGIVLTAMLLLTYLNTSAHAKKVRISLEEPCGKETVICIQSPGMRREYRKISKENNQLIVIEGSKIFKKDCKTLIAEADGSCNGKSYKLCE